MLITHLLLSSFEVFSNGVDGRCSLDGLRLVGYQPCSVTYERKQWQQKAFLIHSFICPSSIDLE